MFRNGGAKRPRGMFGSRELRQIHCHSRHTTARRQLVKRKHVDDILESMTSVTQAMHLFLPAQYHVTFGYRKYCSKRYPWQLIAI